MQAKKFNNAQIQVFHSFYNPALLAKAGPDENWVYTAIAIIDLLGGFFSIDVILVDFSN